MTDPQEAVATDVADQVKPSTVQVINRAADILRFLQTRPAGVTQAEIASGLGMARTTVHRIVGALTEEGFVAAGASGTRSRYRLGGEIARLASAARRSLISSMHPLLEEVSRATDETADLSMLDGSRVTFIDQVVAPHRLRAVSAIGESFPAATTANGKALLAALAPSAFGDPALGDELDRVRAEGVAYDREEHTVGICAIGAVVGEVLGEVVAVSVPMPAQRFYGREAELRTLLLDVLARYRDDAPDR